MTSIDGTKHIDASKAYERGQLPLKSNLDGNSIKDMYNYYLFYPVTHIQQHGGSGDYFEDGKKGIYPFSVGENRMYFCLNTDKTSYFIKQKTAL